MSSWGGNYGIYAATSETRWEFVTPSCSMPYHHCRYRVVQSVQHTIGHQAPHARLFQPLHAPVTTQ